MPEIPIKDILKKAGGGSKVARALGIHPSAVSQWPRVPAEHLHRVAQMAGIPAKKIRPDMFEPVQGAAQ